MGCTALAGLLVNFALAVLSLVLLVLILDRLYVCLVQKKSAFAARVASCVFWQNCNEMMSAMTD